MVDNAVFNGSLRHSGHDTGIELLGVGNASGGPNRRQPQFPVLSHTCEYYSFDSRAIEMGRGLHRDVDRGTVSADVGPSFESNTPTEAKQQMKSARRHENPPGGQHVAFHRFLDSERRMAIKLSSQHAGKRSGHVLDDDNRPRVVSGQLGQQLAQCKRTSCRSSENRDVAEEWTLVRGRRSLRRNTRNRSRGLGAGW